MANSKFKPHYLSKSMTIDLNNVTNEDAADLPVSDATQAALNAKQDTLVSGTNIKTINSTSLLGSGDIAISGSGTVTTVSIVSANGVSGTVANDTTTPAITLSLGAISPSSVTSTFTGALTGNVTGNCSGSSGSCTGNAATATTATTAGACSGNSATATALQTARAINGTNFDGTADISTNVALMNLTASANTTIPAGYGAVYPRQLTVKGGVMFTIGSDSILQIT